MLAEFSFTRFHAHNERDGSHTHGWSVIASALFVDGPGRAVFGEVLADAIPLRLLQMFMGLPWVSTYTAAATAVKRLKFAKSERPNAAQGMKERLRGRLGAIEASLASARGRVRPGRDRSELRAKLLAQDARLLSQRIRVEETRQEAFRLERQLQGATTVLRDTRRALQQLTDDRAAGVVLRTLRPVCCPSCDTGIDHDRYARAGEIGTCALCGTRQVEGSEEEGLRLEELQRDVNDVAANVTELSTEMGKAQATQKQAETDLASSDISRSRDLCRESFRKAGVVVRSSNYTLYGDMSGRVMRVLSNFTPNLEIYSIDEAFLSLAGFDARCEAHARELRRTVLQWTGIPVSVGIAPTKTLAKVANRLAKKDAAAAGSASRRRSNCATQIIA